MPHLIRYLLPVGDRFTIDASGVERVEVAGERILDLDVSFALSCVVREVGAHAVTIDGTLERPVASGTLLGRDAPALEGLAGTAVEVRKGLDGSIVQATGGEPLESLLGGMTLSNGLRWYGATFASRPVDVGDGWEAADRWVLSAERSPIRLRIPIAPVVDVTYRYRLERVDGTVAHIGVAIDVGGTTRSPDLGLELDVTGRGVGAVEVDLAVGKLTRSTREATIDLVPRAVRRRALALPPMRVTRTSLAGVRATGSS